VEGNVDKVFGLDREDEAEGKDEQVEIVLAEAKWKLNVAALL